MPSFEGRDRRQLAVYFAYAGRDRYGNPKVLPPKQVTVRWVAKRHEAVDPNGNTIGVDVQIKLGFEPVIDSIMWLGSLKAWRLLSPEQIPHGTLMQVISADGTPDIKNRFHSYSANLMRYTDTLPEVVPLQQV